MKKFIMFLKKFIIILLPLIILFYPKFYDILHTKPNSHKFKNSDIKSETYEFSSQNYEYIFNDNNLLQNKLKRKGVSIFTKDEENIPILKESILRAKEIGANFIILSITICNNFDTNLPKPTLSYKNIDELIKFIQNLGLEVSIKCHNFSNTNLENTITKNKTNFKWFDNYKELLLSLGEISSQNGVTHFLISNEMANLTTDPRYLNYWIDIINSLKSKFKFNIGSSINLYEAYNGYLLYDYLDFYGLNIYPSLTFNGISEDIVNLKKAYFHDIYGWNTIPFLEKLSVDKKEIWITEIGCMPTKNSLSSPAYWGGDDSITYDERTQELYYKLIFSMLGNLDFINTLSIWCGNLDDPFSFADKLSENIIRKNYSN